MLAGLLGHLQQIDYRPGNIAAPGRGHIAAPYSRAGLSSTCRNTGDDNIICGQSTNEISTLSNPLLGLLLVSLWRGHPLPALHVLLDVLLRQEGTATEEEEQQQRHHTIHIGHVP